MKRDPEEERTMIEIITVILIAVASLMFGIKVMTRRDS